MKQIKLTLGMRGFKSDLSTKRVAVIMSFMEILILLHFPLSHSDGNFG
jgi:hypothetical protein